MIDLAVLADLDLAELRHRWHDAFGSEPLARLSCEVLVAALSYHAQEQSEGGLSKLLARRLDKLAAQLASTGTVSVVAEVAIRPGTRLVREWNGAVHEVIVLADRYLWQGRSHASLSEIARAITGARWSGPRFFGTAAKPASKGTRQ